MFDLITERKIVLVALVLLVVILGLLKWWDHCAKDE